jgi:hypothetical protein
VSCNKDHVEIQLCFQRVCPNDNWTQWYEWSKCEFNENKYHICSGVGIETRERMCGYNGEGRSCIGHTTQQRICKLNQTIDVIKYCKGNIQRIEIGNLIFI